MLLFVFNHSTTEAEQLCNKRSWLKWNCRSVQNWNRQSKSKRFHSSNHTGICQIFQFYIFALIFLYRLKHNHYSTHPDIFSDVRFKLTWNRRFKYKRHHCALQWSWSFPQQSRRYVDYVLLWIYLLFCAQVPMLILCGFVFWLLFQISFLLI